MRKISTTVPTAPAQPNAPAMSAAAPVKAMPAPMPSGATTPPPMNQPQGNQAIKMADTKDGVELPKGAKGGIAGALIGALAAAGGVSKAHKAIPLKPPSGIPSHLYDARRQDFYNAIAKAVGTSLAGAALGVGAEHLGAHMSKVLKGIRHSKEKDKASG